MAHVREEQVLAALRMVRDPKRGQDIVSLGMVAGLRIEGGRVSFALEIDPADGAALEPLRQSAEDVVRMVAGVESAAAVLTAHRPRPAQAGPETARAPQTKAGLDGVGTIVAVASGKGGVGKSTVAANLAVALVAHGLKVGLLDCDVYGPSVPLMMGVKDKPGRGAGGKLKPPESFGVKVMSMGFLATDKQQNLVL